VPLTHGWSYLLAPFLALSLVGGLALVLKWAFSDVAEPDDLDDIDARPSIADGLLTGGPPPEVPLADAPRAESPLADAPLPDVPLAEAPVASAPFADGPVAEAAYGARPAAPAHDDYGLLSVVTAVESDGAAHAAVTLLAEAGIRATTATGSDGHVRVLVFDTDLFRARRVVGWPA
jgi:hypothetical protein